jgi:hypothetical protein
MEILREYLELCWFSNDPLELPRSVSLFKKNFVIYFIIGYLMLTNMIDDPIEAFYEIVLQMVIMFGFIGFMLFLNKTLYVYVQIMTAFMLSANVISIFLIPVMVWLTVSEDLYSYYLFFTLLTWYYAIVAYIFKLSLVINVPASMVLALFYFIATFLSAFALGQVL